MSKTSSRVFIGLACLSLACLSLLLVVASRLRGRFEPEVRSRVIQYLEQRFDSRVSLESLDISVPSISPVGMLLHAGAGTVAHIEGRKLALRYQGRQDVPPLFSADSFAFNLDLGMLRAVQPHVPYVLIEGMTIVLPPKSDNHPAESQQASRDASDARRVVIDKLDFSHARLIILPKRSDAKPLDFAIDIIHMESAGASQQLTYKASLTNPRPPGLIRCYGTFGPWSAATPGDTPLEGDFDFSNADLSVFGAIAGILHSSGHFMGTLSAVRAKGTALVPDFRLQASGNRVPLFTQYAVLVDGLNGNTILEPVHARLRNTEFETSGGIIKHEPTGRRAINLTLDMQKGHIEDLLLLAAKGKPFMSGLIRMNAKISIPPLSGAVPKKLYLNGAFNIAQGEFLRDGVQNKVDELSRRGQGRPGDASVGNVFSSMTGTFRLENQVMTFTQLNFVVPGAAVGLHGEYRMVDDILDFHGDLKLRAKVSETLTGWKRWLAKPIDPLFHKNGAGTFLKIQVVGSAKSPDFGLDHGK